MGFTTVLTAAENTTVTQAQWEAQVADNLNYCMVTPISEVLLESSTSAVVFDSLHVSNGSDLDIGSAWAHMTLMWRARSNDSNADGTDSVELLIGDQTATDSLSIGGWAVNDVSGATRTYEATAPLGGWEVPNGVTQANQYGCGWVHFSSEYSSRNSSSLYHICWAGVSAYTKNSDTATNNTGLMVAGGRPGGDGFTGKVTWRLRDGSIAAGSLFTLYGWGVI